MIRIYSKEGCKYCDMAKQLADASSIKYEEMTVGATIKHDVDRIDFMNQFPDIRTLPLIVKVDSNGEISERIGGYAEFSNYVQVGAL